MVEALLYGCAAWTPLKGDYQRLRAPHTTGCCFGSSVPGAGRGTTGSSHTISPFNLRPVRVLRPPCSRGGCCGQGRSFEWTTADCPDGSWWGPSRTLASVDGEARRKSGWTAWQTTYGCSGSGMGGMENCGIRSRQVVGSYDGRGAHVYGHMEDGRGESI